MNKQKFIGIKQISQKDKIKKKESKSVNFMIVNDSSSLAESKSSKD